MTCDEAEILLHALIDGELDAGHAREVEDHLAGCPRCAAQLAAYRAMSEAVARADLPYAAPAALRRRIEAALPRTAAPSRRAVLRGFAMGSAAGSTMSMPTRSAPSSIAGVPMSSICSSPRPPAPNASRPGSKPSRASTSGAGASGD